LAQDVGDHAPDFLLYCGATDNVLRNNAQTSTLAEDEYMDTHGHLVSVDAMKQLIQGLKRVLIVLLLVLQCSLLLWVLVDLWPQTEAGHRSIMIIIIISQCLTGELACFLYLGLCIYLFLISWHFRSPGENLAGFLFIRFLANRVDSFAQYVFCQSSTLASLDSSMTFSFSFRLLIQ
jgi:hypothetical protein